MIDKDIEYYPKIKIPEYFILDNYKKIDIPFPKEPNKPQKKYPVYSKKPFFSTSIYIIILLIIITMAAPDVILFTFYGILFLCIYKYISHNRHKNKYYKLLRESDYEYSIQIKKFSEEFHDWQKAKNRIYELQRIAKNEHNSENPRRDFLKKLISFDEISLDDSMFNKSGMSEKIFFNHLHLEFDDKIKRNCSICLSGINYDYTPDFIYNDEDIYIDIEIDEPYTLIGHEAIHYSFDDEMRDEFFLHTNWAVIRFTERQVIKEPNNCIETIKSVIEIMEGKTNNYFIYTNYEKAWTKEEAEEMANNCIREKYLGIERVKLKPKETKTKIDNDDLPF